MSARERLRVARCKVLDYSPVHLAKGRIYVGRAVVLTRSELRRTVIEFEELGERRGVERVARLLAKADLGPTSP